ncbi:MAG: hypothetical protein AVW05_01975 [Hadesarchaea archaeon DG-33]|nr:MAG: hypothetical protein AVW05_01975 [Hadesarchaea archaeon DG-33]
MPAFRTLALVILAAFVVSIFILGYQFLQGLDRERRARDAALELNNGVQAVIATGNPQTVEITVPAGYKLKFENQRVSINGFAVPENGYLLQVTDLELSEGSYVLTITLEGNSVVVSK